MEDRKLYMDLFGEQETPTLDEDQIMYPETAEELQELISGMKRKDAL